LAFNFSNLRLLEGCSNIVHHWPFEGKDIQGKGRKYSRIQKKRDILRNTIENKE